ncbi:TIGR03087 family PEP-CTERM/XrtA system glycosyltransferase [Sphingomonas sp. SUN039]|uniref:TIGR03087 family PEP-CTERM/XrtA system glycosyltransferase n=1 Tax=Sphingomonas sp. SUN039 TaxID=2937787 RepID=UPI0021645AD9|nr:TIGR03087 family PEP-CTERM/XrtA system glycosyltransferase [Sphingomonas sp. SUN039]UVO53299.1 TIGR03087 family PEP-CTERM/XrtA system glycosyltransferase [Sphingomonas sp. SUN039]
MSGTDILFLAHRLPWPPDRGDRIRSWHMLEALAKLRPVHVVTPLDSAEDRQHIAKVESVAASVTTAVRPSSKGIAVARALLTGLPASVALFSVPVLHQAVRNRLASGEIGTVFAFSGQMAHYVPLGVGARFIMDFVDMDSAKFAQQGASAHGLSGLALRHEAKRLLAFETATARRADAALFVSEAEAALFRTTTGLSAQTLENGVDAAHFAPDAVEPADAPHPLIVFTGQMDYAPNVEAVTGFVRDVLPSLPTATFAIVGRSPTAAVRALAAPNVIVTGEVPDTRPWLAAADVVVAPLALARGIQNKVLEAMAMGKAVVASPAAADGIDAEAGAELLVADTPAAQAAVIGTLLADPLHARAIGTAARDLVRSRYSWSACLAPLAGLVA